MGPPSDAARFTSDAARVASDAPRVTSDAARVASGAPRVASGAPGVTSDAARVASGAPRVASGAPRVTSDATRVASGVARVTSGAARVAEVLARSAGAPVSGASLARDLSITRAAVWKHVRSLRAAGFRIEGRPGAGYLLASRPDVLLAAEVQAGLGTRVVGRRVVCLPAAPSTNDVARRLGLAGEPEGCVVLAEVQTAGRGRRGRTWVSPPGGIYGSVLLRPAVRTEEAPRLTLLAAVAAAEAVEAVCGLRPGIKWPNDLTVDGRKFCGILTDLVADDEAVSFAVVGIGIDANLAPGALPDDLSGTATSLQAVRGGPVDRLALLRELLRRLDAWYGVWLGGGWARALQRWRDFSVTLGRPVVVSGPGVAGAGAPVAGTAVDVDETGALVLDLGSGSTLRVLGGEVTLREP